jgi:hypothetical protein
MRNAKGEMREGPEIGEPMGVRITKATAWSLQGELVDAVEEIAVA